MNLLFLLRFKLLPDKPDYFPSTPSSISTSTGVTVHHRYHTQRREPGERWKKSRARKICGMVKQDEHVVLCVDGCSMDYGSDLGGALS